MEIPEDGGCDFPSRGLLPVAPELSAEEEDFKPKPGPSWWPLAAMTDWLVQKPVKFDSQFLEAPTQEIRDHVQLDPATGAAEEGRIFGTAGLNLTHLPRHGVKLSDRKLPFQDRHQNISLSARVTFAETAHDYFDKVSTWHPLGGERRLVHWQSRGDVAPAWKCPTNVEDALAKVKPGGGIRMVLATPGIFANGWLPTGIDPHTLEGRPVGDGPKLKLVGACISRWKAVSGWAYAPHAEDNGSRRIVPKEKPGPKAIRRMVPAGGVYFFELLEGDPRILATNGWLKPISDDPFDRRDGFGLALWGTW
jgi:CRISPR-associated protein Cmr3